MKRAKFQLDKWTGSQCCSNTRPNTPKGHLNKALKALSFLSTNEANKIILLKSTVRHLLPLLLFANPKIVILTAAILNNVSDTGNLFLESLGVDNLLALLPNLKNSPPLTQQIILRILKSCAHNDDFNLTLLKRNSVDVFLAILQSDNEYVLSELLELLNNVASKVPVFRDDLITAKVGPRLMYLMSCFPNEKFQRIGITLLSTLVYDNRGAENVLEIPRIFQELVCLMYHPNLPVLLCKLFQKLLVDDNAKMSFVKAGGIDTSIFLLFSGVFEVKLSALELLIKFADSQKFQVYLLKFSLISFLKELKGHGNLQTEENQTYSKIYPVLLDTLIHLSEQDPRLARGTLVLTSVWLKVVHRNLGYFRFLKISTKILLANLIPLVEKVFDERIGNQNTKLSEKLEQKKTSQTRLIRREGEWMSEIKTDQELHNMLEECLRGTPIVCEVIQVSNGPQNVVESPKLDSLKRKSSIKNQLIRQATPETYKKFREKFRDELAKVVDDQIRTSKKIILKNTIEGDSENLPNIVRLPEDLEHDLKTAVQRKGIDPEAGRECPILYEKNLENALVKRWVGQITLEGKKTWKTDMLHWESEIQRVFGENPRSIRMLFNLIDTPNDHKNFNDVLKFMKNSPLPLAKKNQPISAKMEDPSVITEWLLNVGFWVKQSKYSIERNKKSEEVVETDCIIRPPDFPSKYVLKSILVATNHTQLLLNKARFADVMRAAEKDVRNRSNSK